MPSGSDIREMFLHFFEQKGHRRVHSSSLVPANDPTLLFTNAGMNQFKDVFLGLEKRDYNRATSSQKCVRAGGKHNDLENVGFTNRHHTFFEMLGNFSFGDYFKKDAIAFAWELVTSPKWFAISKDKLYATIFKGDAFADGSRVPRDDEAYQHWLSVGVPKERIFEMGMKDNFWAMGDTGPCGPCSEIHYDMGPAASDQGHADCHFPCDCGRYVEIWNLVFMQFDRDPSGKLKPLPKPCVDTGAGLERVTAVLQGKISNYDTDLFQPLMQRAAELCGVNLQKELQQESKTRSAASLRVIADHARACTFLISDGVLPSNEGRGYVLRKILRRGIRHGRLLGATKPFMFEMAHAVRDLMKDAYPELVDSAERVSKAIFEEERRFAHTLEEGMQAYDAEMMEQLIESTLTVQNNAREIRAGLEGIKLPSPEDKNRESLVNTWAGLERDVQSNARELAAGLEGIKYLHPQTGGLRKWLTDNISDLERHRSRFETRFKSRFSPARGANERALWLQTVRNLLVHADDTANSTEQLTSKYRDRLKDELLLTYVKAVKEATRPKFPGEKAFKLYDTYGVPRDFIEDACRDAGIEFDSAGFDRAMEAQRERARASWKGGAGKATASPAFRELPRTRFEGYSETRSDDCEVLAIVHNGRGVRELRAGEQGEIVLDHTPFYADSGGQIGDVGWFYSDDHNTVTADVHGCVMPVQGVRAHKVTARQPIHVGQKVDAVVNAEVREATMRNHTATHLLHAALRETLGKHVKQAGSLVDPTHLRFDFSHFTGVADEELQDIEDLVNKEVLRNERVEVFEDVPIDVAINEYKAMALFGEKYGDRVRVIKIGDFSTELCGGTHTEQTGEIGLVKILDEGSVSSGVRRVEAVTGEGSLRHFRRDHELERAVSSLIRREQAESPAEAVKLELASKEEEIKKLRRELEQARMKSAASSVASAEERVRVVNGIKVLAQRVDNLERPQMRTLVDNLRNKLGSGVVVLGSAIDGKVALIVGVTKDLTGKVQAGKIISPIAQKVGGSGGGRPDMAEAGGKDPSQLDGALNEAYGVVESLAK